jgi:hypothetical protein
MTRSILREVAAFVFYLVIAIGLTWPLAIRLGTAVPDFGDPLLNAWIVDWVSYALTHRPLDLFDAPIFHPATMPLAFSENLIGIALFAIPFQLAGLKALTVYNIMLLAGFAHAGYGAFVLARMVTRHAGASLLAGVFFAFCQYKFDHLSHLQIIWSGWIPLMLAALLAYWQRPSIKAAALLFGAFVMNGLTNIHFLLFGGVALVVAVIVLALREPRRERQFWIQLAGALALGGAVLLPVLFPYRAVAELYQMKRARHEVEFFSVKPSEWLYTTTRSRVYGKYMPADVQHERTLFPGLVPLFLLAAAVVSEGRPRRVKVLDAVIVLLAVLSYFAAVADRFTVTLGGKLLLALRETDIPMFLLMIGVLVRLYLHPPRTSPDRRFPPAMWVAVAWVVVGFLGSLGLHTFFHSFFYQRVEGFAALRVPARWAIIAYAGLSLWVAAGAMSLMRRRVFAAVLPLLMVVDVLPSIRWEHAPVDPPRFYRWLVESRVGPVLELPAEDGWSGHFVYLLRAAEHRVPLMNGTSGFEPPVHFAIRDAYNNDRLNEAFTAFLERNGCRIVVLHADTLAEKHASVAKWVEGGLASGRIAFLRRFDNGVGGDWVFALTRNLPDWKTWQDYDKRSSLQRFLGGLPTYNSTTFGRLDTPRLHEQQNRQLRVSGWVLSPHGIRSATARLYSGRLRVPMQFYDRPDVIALHPWYPKTPRPGIIATLPKRPKGMPRETDVQIEIVDGAGNVTLLRDIPFTWN